MNESVTNKPPGLFWAIGGAALVWNLLGIVAYVGQVSMSAETLAAMPEAERALYENVPAWVTAAFAIAVNAGAVGCLLLLLRKGLAVPLLVLSLIAAVLQMFHSVVLTEAVSVMGARAIIMPVIIIGICAYLVWFAMDAKKKGWIG